MTKVLHVINPFFVMSVGDKFELSKDGMYKSSYKESNNTVDDNSHQMYSSYESNYEISPAYAETLIKGGYLAEDKEEKSKNTPFVNVFDEIDNMIEAYTDDLKNLDADMAEQPKALKVEKETVLTNLIKALNHLKSVKK